MNLNPLVSNSDTLAAPYSTPALLTRLPPHTRLASQESSGVASPSRYSPPLPAEARITEVAAPSCFTQMLVLSRLTPCDRKCALACSAVLTGPATPPASLAFCNSEDAENAAESLSRLIDAVTAAAALGGMEMPLSGLPSASSDCNRISRLCNLAGLSPANSIGVMIAAPFGLPRTRVPSLNSTVSPWPNLNMPCLSVAPVAPEDAA